VCKGLTDGVGGWEIGGVKGSGLVVRVAGWGEGEWGCVALGPTGRVEW